MNFEEFVGARLDALLRYATALCCDPHLAQDVVQEVLDFYAGLDSPGDLVTVNGAPGRVKVDKVHDVEAHADIRWRPDNDTVLRIDVLTESNPGELAKRLAGSARPDGKATLVPALTFGALPPEFKYLDTKVTRVWTGHGACKIYAFAAGNNPAISAWIVDKDTPADLDHPHTVGIPTADGRELRLASDGNKAVPGQQLTDIAKATKIEPNPDYSWAGTR